MAKLPDECMVEFPQRDAITVNTMVHTSIYATYALDEETDQLIKCLAETWRVSQSEVVRRSVRDAAQHARETLTPADVVAGYRSAPLSRCKSETKRLSEEIRQLRHYDDERRGRGLMRDSS